MGRGWFGQNEVLRQQPCLSSTFLEGPLGFPGPCCAAVLFVELGWVGLGRVIHFGLCWVIGLHWVTHLGLG